MRCRILHAHSSKYRCDLCLVQWSETKLDYYRYLNGIILTTLFQAPNQPILDHLINGVLQKIKSTTFTSGKLNPQPYVS